MVDTCCTASRNPPQSRSGSGRSALAAFRAVVVNVALLLLSAVFIAAVSGQETGPRNGEWTQKRCLETYAANTKLHYVKTYPRRLASHHAVGHQHHSLVTYQDEVRAGSPCLHLPAVVKGFRPDGVSSCVQVQRIFSQQLSLPETVLERSFSNRGDTGRLRRLFQKLRAGLY